MSTRHSLDEVTEDLTEEDIGESTDTNNYQLVRDREPRIKKPTQRFGYADLIAYALSMTNSQ